MTKKKEEIDYDVRIVERNIREGAVSKKDYDKFIKSLPDVEEKGEPLVFDDEIETPEAELEQTDIVEDAEETEESEEEETQ